MMWQQLCGGSPVRVIILNTCWCRTVQLPRTLSLVRSSEKPAVRWGLQNTLSLLNNQFLYFSVHFSTSTDKQCHPWEHRGKEDNGNPSSTEGEDERTNIEKSYFHNKEDLFWDGKPGLLWSLSVKMLVRRSLWLLESWSPLWVPQRSESDPQDAPPCQWFSFFYTCRPLDLKDQGWRPIVWQLQDLIFSTFAFTD